MFVRGGSRDFVSTQDFYWDIGKENSGWVLLVLKGTEFESSVPKLFRWFLSPDDPRFLKAALIHDYLLESGYTRAFADSQWLEVNLSEHTPKIKTKLAYLGMVLKRLNSYVK